MSTSVQLYELVPMIVRTIDALNSDDPNKGVLERIVECIKGPGDGYHEDTPYIATHTDIVNLVVQLDAEHCQRKFLTYISLMLGLMVSYQTDTDEAFRRWFVRNLVYFYKIKGTQPNWKLLWTLSATEKQARVTELFKDEIHEGTVWFRSLDYGLIPAARFDLGDLSDFFDVPEAIPYVQKIDIMRPIHVLLRHYVQSQNIVEPGINLTEVTSFVASNQIIETLAGLADEFNPPLVTCMVGCEIAVETNPCATSCEVSVQGGGAEGPPGPAGVNGANGANGAPGTNGTNGTNGTDGHTPQVVCKFRLISYGQKTGLIILTGETDPALWTWLEGKRVTAIADDVEPALSANGAPWIEGKVVASTVVKYSDLPVANPAPPPTNLFEAGDLAPCTASGSMIVMKLTECIWSNKGRENPAEGNPPELDTLCHTGVFYPNSTPQELPTGVEYNVLRVASSGIWIADWVRAHA